MRFVPLCALVGVLVLSIPGSASAQQMYGSVGTQSGLNPGGILIVDPNTGVGTFVGDAITPGGVTGLAFDSTGALYGTARFGGGAPGSDLLLIDPNTGAGVNLGAIQDGAANDVGISDLAFQPGTDVLYGNSAVGSPCEFCVYTIDTTTAVATLVGDPLLANGGLAFDPNGLLYLATSVTPADLAILDPNDASVVSSIVLGLPVSGLGISPSGEFYATGPANSDALVEIDPLTGGAVVVGFSGAGSTADLDFRPAPPPAQPVPTLPVVGWVVAFALVVIFLRHRIA